MRRRIKIIANPVSGRGRAKRLAEAVIARLRSRGADPELLETRAAGDARRLAGQTAGAEAVGVVGGDGTLNEVANGLPDAAPPLGILPSGTANVLAKELRLRRDPPWLADVLADGREIRWDLGIDRAGGRRFLLFVSAGYDAQVVHLFHARRRGAVHMWQYCLWGVKSFWECAVPRIGVALDGATLTEAAAWVIVSNVAQYGGPLAFTPNAKPDDGAFEVLVLHDRGRRDTVRMFWRAIVGWLTGLDLELGGVSFHRAARVRLWSADGRDVAVQVDGDPGGSLPVDLELRPGGVRVLAP